MPPENASITGLKSPGPGSLHVTAKLNIIHFSEILMIYGLDSIEAEEKKLTIAWAYLLCIHRGKIKERSDSTSFWPGSVC